MARRPRMPAARSRPLVALLAVTALMLLGGAAPVSAEAQLRDDRVIATELPESPVGRQVAWFLEASKRLPLGDAEWRAHVTQRFLAVPGASPAELDAALSQVIDARGVRLLGVVIAEPRALVALVATGGGQELVLTFVADRTGLIERASLQQAGSGPPITLPAPTGPAVVGTDLVQLVDRARGGRRLMLTRWYPAAGSARSRPRAPYASPRLLTALGLPRVRATARERPRPRRGRLPVVLLSPGLGGTRVIYQALAEDLASRGYLVIAVDHTGEAPVEFPDGRFAVPPLPPRDQIASAATTRLGDMRLLLRRLTRLPSGPRPDRRRVAAIGHSFGGSTAAALMRVEPTIRAGVDMDGSIFGAARRRGVPRAFLVMTGGEGLDPTLRSMLRNSSGPRLALAFAGLEHMSFSDLPVLASGAPGALGARTAPSARDIAVQRAYLGAFLDRYLRGRHSSLLERPSPRWPQVSVRYRRDCCALTHADPQRSPTAIVPRASHGDAARLESSAG